MNTASRNPPSLRQHRVNGIRPATRPSSWPCPPLKSSSARAASCAWATRSPHPRCASCRRARWGWTLRSASVGCRAAAWSRSTVPSHRARPRWPCTWWRRLKSWVASARSSMQNMRWMSATRANWECAPTTSWWRSRITVSRRSISPRCWFARGRWTWWWWIRSPRSRRARNWKVRWATRTWVCRHA